MPVKDPPLLATLQPLTQLTKVHYKHHEEHVNDPHKNVSYPAVLF
jgi:hypothetical protein